MLGGFALGYSFVPIQPKTDSRLTEMISPVISVLLFCLFTSIASVQFPAAGEVDLRSRSPGETLCTNLISPAGYPCTEYTIETKDGYLLALQRVSSRNGDLRLQRRPPVLLQHGLFMAGDAWFLGTPEESLGYILADQGFDVWVGNIRGTFWSYGHISLSERDKEFWDWSWQELALYDLAEMIHHVYSATNSKVHIVGHSQGTIMSLAALTQPNIVEMVEAAALLCPISYLDHISAPLVLRMVSLHLDQMIQAMGIHQLNFRSQLLVNILEEVLDGHVGFGDVLSSITVIRQGTFSRYDYGMFKNLKVYGKPEPSAFDLSLIPNSLPLWMGYGGYDALADVTDVHRTLKELQSKPELLYLDKYGHVDFLLSSRAKVDVFDNMIDFFRSLGNSSSL